MSPITNLVALFNEIPTLSGFIKLVKLAFARRRVHRTRLMRIGRHSIELPPGHLLDIYKISHQMYDVHLQCIGAVIARKYPDFWAVDIGANIGDSAAAITAMIDIPTVCIEGDPSFYQSLESNSARLGSFIHQVNAYVGAQRDTVTANEIFRSGGTARIGKRTPSPALAVGEVRVEMAPLAQLLEPFAAVNFKFLKIDTDGFDFTIIKNALNWIESYRPIVLFECDTSFPGCELAVATETTESLHRVGYRTFLVFDNYGKFVAPVSDGLDALNYMIANLSKSRQHRRGVKYLDIYAFHDMDSDLFTAFRSDMIR